MIVCTFPGKHGDLLWALPTVRAIAETYQEQVLLVISPYVKSLAPLLRRQDYIYSCVVDDAWQVHLTAPMSPRTPPTAYHAATHVFHLGYEGWPSPDLPRDIWRCASEQTERALQSLDLDRPWIAPPSYAQNLPAAQIAVGFTDEWFELKYGIYQLLRRQLEPLTSSYDIVNLSTSPRWQVEASLPPMDWDTAAAWMSRARLFVGCCSALHVLACAIGTPVVVVEPNEARWQDLFYPYGKATDRVRLLLGGDGRPTFDARHLMDALRLLVPPQEVTR